MESVGKNESRQFDRSEELGTFSERVPVQMTELMNRKRLETKEVVPNPVLLPESGFSENTLFSIPGTDGIRRMIEVRQSSEQKGFYMVDVRAQFSHRDVNTPKRLGHIEELDKLYENIGNLRVDSRNAQIREVLDQAYNRVRGWSPTPVRTRK